MPLVWAHAEHVKLLRSLKDGQVLICRPNRCKGIKHRASRRTSWSGVLIAVDALQLYNKIPSASATVLQGLLFVAALAVSGLSTRLEVRYG